MESIRSQKPRLNSPVSQEKAIQARPHWYRRTRVRAAVRAVLSSTTSARWRLMSR